ncbi:MAG: transglycosylase SLT domain-containing protein [Verrucomicrobia bacterium]|nr:transglycosylase SLT domain-containing protein [Verrucomicrobiota bacterium]
MKPHWRRLLLVLFMVMLACLAAACWWWQGWLERSQDIPIRAAARRYKVEPALVKAVVWRESRFHPQARGRAQEIGLMQIRETAAQEWADAEHLEGRGRTTRSPTRWPITTPAAATFSNGSAAPRQPTALRSRRISASPAPGNT